MLNGSNGQEFVADVDQAVLDKWVDRYCLLVAIMRNEELFTLAMHDFDDETQFRLEPGQDLRARSLARNKGFRIAPITPTLSTYEGLCWFGVQPQIMSGLLSEEEFFETLGGGYMVKDPGPGPQHGEVSHRIQWHYIMRIMTDSFHVPYTETWGCSPLELFVQMVKIGLKRNVWGVCLEGTGNVVSRAGVSSSAPGSTVLTPGDPNWINRAFIPVGVTESAFNFKKQIEEINPELDKASDPQRAKIAAAENGSGRFADTPFGRAITARFGKRQDLHEAIATFGSEWAHELGIAGLHSYVSRARSNRITEEKAGVDYAATFIVNWLKTGFPADLQQVVEQALNIRGGPAPSNQEKRDEPLWLAYRWYEDRETQERKTAWLAANPTKRLPQWVSKPNFDKRLAFYFWLENYSGDYDETDPRRYSRAKVGDTQANNLLRGGNTGLLIDLDVEDRRDRSGYGLNPHYVFVPGQGASEVNPQPLVADAPVDGDGPDDDVLEPLDRDEVDAEMQNFLWPRNPLMKG